MGARSRPSYYILLCHPGLRGPVTMVKGYGDVRPGVYFVSGNREGLIASEARIPRWRGSLGFG